MKVVVDSPQGLLKCFVRFSLTIERAETQTAKRERLEIGWVGLAGLAKQLSCFFELSLGEAGAAVKEIGFEKFRAKPERGFKFVACGLMIAA